MTDPMSGPNPVNNGLCGAKTRSGTPCKLAAGHGTSHVGTGRCRRHGGSSPQAELAGQVVLARREAMVMGRPLDVQPHDAILECIRIAAGEVQYASDRISELAPAEAVGPVVTTRPLKHEKGAESRTERVEEHGPPAVHIWITVRHQAMDRLVTYSKVAIAAGIAEREIRLAEQQGHLLAQVIRGVLTDLGVHDDPRAPDVVRRHLALVAG